MTKWNGSVVAFAAAIVIALTAAPADAKPQRVCCKPSDGKHYGGRGNPGGYLHAEADECSGSAVFLIHHPDGMKKEPRFDRPVVMKSAKFKRYVWFNTKKGAAFANKSKYKKRDQRFFVKIRPSSGAGKGAPLRPGMKVQMKTVVRGMPFYAKKGGGKGLVIGNVPSGKRRWSKFTMVPARN